VPEDYPVGEALLVVDASDEDRGDNAELTYTLDTASQQQYGQIFRLHPTTGQVRFVTGSVIFVTKTKTRTRIIGVVVFRELELEL